MYTTLRIDVYMLAFNSYDPLGLECLLTSLISLLLAEGNIVHICHVTIQGHG